jgi:hypothetical protein
VRGSTLQGFDATTMLWQRAVIHGRDSGRSGSELPPAPQLLLLHQHVLCRRTAGSLCPCFAPLYTTSP